jgi:hypothetical protein
MTQFPGTISFPKDSDADLPVTNGARLLDSELVPFPLNALLNVLILDRLDKIEARLAGKEKQERERPGRPTRKDE